MKLPRGTSGTISAAALAAAVTLTYWNHFHNAFHFDDFHSITDNVYIRDLKNIPRFFWDSATSSTLPTHWAWRPLVTSSLALDYWLGRGYAPRDFHVSTFVWFLAQLALMYVVFQAIVYRRAVAWLAVACYGLHPAIADTVNYVIQRADVMSTCCVVAALATYAQFPNLRRYGIYLIPASLGVLAKPPALIFPLVLFAYVFLVEEQAGVGALTVAVRKAIPALVVAAALAILQSAMTPKTFTAGSPSAYSYLITQPYVAFRYFSSFFLPAGLTADTDLAPLASIWTLEGLGGLLFLAVLIYAIFAAARHASTRAIAFGLCWFLLAMVPTSAFPLAEVENTHRMYFPFVGLTLATASAASLLLRGVTERAARAFVATALGGLLLVLAFATRRRNEVWRSEESLWQDVTIKSPHNGRGWMNYGLTQMAKGDTRKALLLFEQAAVYTPNYPLLEINLGIANGALQRDADANAHFQRAIHLDPKLAECYFYYGRWLKERGRLDEAAANLKTAIQMSPASLDARYQLLALYAERGQTADLKALANDTLKLAPADEIAKRYANQRAAPETAASLLELSLARYQARDYAGSIGAAQKALALDPRYAEAYNNIAAANAALGQWDAAIQAAQQALRLKPDFPLARNNLAWAESQKSR